jgi:hypothetical protein
MPGLQCSVCAHPDAVIINEAIVLEGRSTRNIAQQYGLHYSAIQRHKEHIPQLLLQVARAEEILRAETLINDIAHFRDATLTALDRAEASENNKEVFMGAREARENVKLLVDLYDRLLKARMMQEQQGHISAEAMHLIVEALYPYPEAAEAVAEALEPLEVLEPRALEAP